MSANTPPPEVISEMRDAARRECEQQEEQQRHEETFSDPEALVTLTDFVRQRGPVVDRWSDKSEGPTQYGAISMANALVYREVCAYIDSYYELELHLKRYSDVAESLGLDEIPDHTTFATTHRERFPNVVRERIEDVAEAIREDLVRLSAPAQYAVEAPDGDWPAYDLPGVPEVERHAKDRAFEKVKPILHDVVDFERAENAEIPADSLVDFAGFLARRNTFPEQGAQRYWVEEGDDVEDHFAPETFRRAVRNKERSKTRVPDEGTCWVEPQDKSVDLRADEPTDDWHGTLEEGVDRLVDQLKDAGVIDGPVPVCIDSSIRPYHKHPEGADEAPAGVYQESYFQTNYGWKDMSASAIINGRSVILANVSRVPGDKFFRAVKYLVDRCRELLDVDCFYADAAFANTDVCRYIEHVGEKYVMKKPHRNRVKDHLDEFDGTADYCDFEMRSPRKNMEHNTTLFGVEKRGQIGVKKGVKRDAETDQTSITDFEGAVGSTGQQEVDAYTTQEDVELVAFVTNLDVDGVGIDPDENPVAHDPEGTVWGVAQRYRRRWAIETAFRQVKYQFLARTASRDLGVRRFFWTLALLLYNSWAVMCLLVQDSVPDLPDDRPPVRAKIFLEQLAKRPPPPD